MRIDSHQHFWMYNPVRDQWMDDTMQAIRRNFIPDDLHPLLQHCKMEGCIAIQADQSESETHFLLSLAEQHDFIKGVVGWVDLRSKNIEERLQYFSQFKKLKGFRHIVQAETDDYFLLRDDFCRGISLLEKYQFTYDLLIYPTQMPAAVEFLKNFPNQKFVLDHLAKPGIKNRQFGNWIPYIEALAKNRNLYCKLSGMLTEADWNNWKPEDFSFCINTIIEKFGVEKIMFGSDWPVCLVAGSYLQVVTMLEENTAHLSLPDKEKLWGGNCENFYLNNA
jgi:L-fuconolactonase